jgi:WD40 repeat protein
VQNHESDVESGKEIRRFQGHTATVESMGFSHDGRRAVSGSNDATSRVWDVDTGQELYRFEGHPAIVWVVAFTPGGNRVVSGSGAADGTMLLWELPKDLTKAPGTN